jgi:integral membrane protein
VSPRQLLRGLAIAEAATWTMLIVGMVLKYATTTTDVGVSIGGGAHGFVFLAYVAGALVVALNQRWRLPVVALVLLSAALPFASIPAERALDRRGLLDGGWRTAPTGDPRDSSPLDRALFWVLGHIVPSAIGAVAAVAAVFVLLLVVGESAA